MGIVVLYCTAVRFNPGICTVPMKRQLRNSGWRELNIELLDVLIYLVANVLLCCLLERRNGREFLNVEIRKAPPPAHLARRTGMSDDIVLGNCSINWTHPGHKVLGGLFEAYVGGMQRELGLEGYPVLYNWFEDMMLPYAQHFHKEICEALEPEVKPERMLRLSFHASAMLTHAEITLKGTTYSRGTVKLKLPLDLTGKDDRTYTNWVHEFCSINHFSTPNYTYDKVGEARHMGGWRCFADLHVEKFSSIATLKQTAKENVCHEIYKYSPHETTTAKFWLAGVKH